MYSRPQVNQYNEQLLLKSSLLKSRHLILKVWTFNFWQVDPVPLGFCAGWLLKYPSVYGGVYKNPLRSLSLDLLNTVDPYLSEHSMSSPI